MRCDRRQRPASPGDTSSGTDGLKARSAVAIQPGKVDRSPAVTALSARMAVLSARGRMKTGDRLTARSLIGSTFSGRILGETTVAGRPAVRPEISGRGWITGIHQHMLDHSVPSPRDTDSPTHGARDDTDPDRRNRKPTRRPHHPGGRLRLCGGPLRGPAGAGRIIGLNAAGVFYPPIVPPYQGR